MVAEMSHSTLANRPLTDTLIINQYYIWTYDNNNNNTATTNAATIITIATTTTIISATSTAATVTAVATFNNG